MSKSIQRNEIIALDGFNFNPQRDTFQPMIKQLTNDLLENGFDDVGPQITKISIHDDELTKFIDEFIIYNYNSNATSFAEGAYGIDDPANPVYGQSVTSWNIDGQYGSRTQAIDDAYKMSREATEWTNVTENYTLDEVVTVGTDYFLVTKTGENIGTAPTSPGSETSINEDAALFKKIENTPSWNQWLSVKSKPTSITQAVGNDVNKTALGPNVELFSYLNPHPDMRGGEDIWKTFGFNSAAVSASTTIPMVDTTFLVVGQTLLEFTQGGTLITDSTAKIASINGRHQITVDSAVTIDAGKSITFGTDKSLFARPNDLKNGHYYKAAPPIPKMENQQKGYVGLSGLARKIYQNEYAKIKRCMTTSARSVSFLPSLDSGINTNAKLRHYKEEPQTDGTLMHHFWISNFKDEFFFPAGTVEPKKYKGDMLIGLASGFTGNTFQVGDTYSFAFTHSPVGSAPDQDIVVDVVVENDNTIQGFTQAVHRQFVKTILADPKGGLYSAKIKEGAIGVIEFESRTIGDNLTMTPARTARVNVSLTNTATVFVVPHNTATMDVGATGATDVTGQSVYIDGYAHKVQIRDLDGSNIEDTFTFTLTGLIDETAADVTQTTAVRDITINYESPTNLNPSELAEALKGVLEANAYIKQYMTVTAGSNFIILEYSSASSGYMKKSLKGVGWGLLASASASITSPATTIGETVAAQAQANGFLVGDLPTHAAFTVDVTSFYAVDADYNDFDSGVGVVTDPITATLNTTTTGIITAVENVRLSFPMARDFGTLANPVSGSYTVGSAWEDGELTNYSASYLARVLHETHSPSTRPEGPQISFGPKTIQDHPNVSHSGIAKGLISSDDFLKWNGTIKIESFEYITDYSMGPIVLETKSTDKLSGNSGDQPWRLRIDVQRGNEVRETSPFVNSSILELTQEESESGSSEFEHLSFHTATKFQLKSDGDVSQIEGRDGIKSAVIREPGFMGALRPQFNGYLETISHLVNPRTNRTELADTLKTGFNLRAGVVGTAHYNMDGDTVAQSTPIGNLAKVFPNTTGTTGAPSIPPSSSTGAARTIDFGVLENGEYRYEERYLVGTSSELVGDTPFNNGRLRLQKGLFRRTGKSDPAIAVTYPMQYTLTVADHGIGFYVRDQASTAQSDDHAWFVIQRHVDATTGLPDFSSTNQPIHCVYQSSEPPVLYSDFQPYFTDKTTTRTNSLAYQGLYDKAGNYRFDFRIDELKDEELKALEMDIQGRFRRFVVREKDVFKPWDRHVFAGLNERDSHAVLNPLEQLALNDAGQLVIQFPNRLGSQRFLYTGTEIDLIAFCGAGAVGQDTLITSDRFSDAQVNGSATNNNRRRLYKGMMSSEPYGNGMRILMMVGGWQGSTELVNMPTDVDTTLLSS
mgnify:CR=1 FL=1